MKGREQSRANDLRQRMSDYESRWGRVPVNADDYDPENRAHISYRQLAELEAIAREGSTEREEAARLADAYAASIRALLADAERNTCRAQGEAQILRAIAETAEEIATRTRARATKE